MLVSSKTGENGGVSAYHVQAVALFHKSLTSNLTHLCKGVFTNLSSPGTWSGGRGEGSFGSGLSSSAPEQYLCILLSEVSESPLLANTMTPVVPFCLINVGIP